MKSEENLVWYKEEQTENDQNTVIMLYKFKLVT